VKYEEKYSQNSCLTIDLCLLVMNIEAIQVCSKAYDELHKYVHSLGVCLLSPEFISKNFYLVRGAQSV
jgi:hypothetical protein